MSTIDEIRNYHPPMLANMADCAVPDTAESAGAVFLIDVRDAALEAWARVQDDEDRHDVTAELANDAPDVYTARRWAEFVDLAAYLEEPELGEWPSDLTEMAGVALYQIAERLINAIFDDLTEDEDEDEDEDES